MASPRASIPSRAQTVLWYHRVQKHQYNPHVILFPELFITVRAPMCFIPRAVVRRIVRIIPRVFSSPILRSKINVMLWGCQSQSQSVPAIVHTPRRSHNGTSSVLVSSKNLSPALRSGCSGRLQTCSKVANRRVCPSRQLSCRDTE